MQTENLLNDSILDFLDSFKNLFSGATTKYGVLENIRRDGESGAKITGDYRTESFTPLTGRTYKEHLAGEKMLGIIPINESNKCKFGVIDVDIYSTIEIWPHLDIIQTHNLPLVPFYSKSGGFHIYCFLKDEVPASDMVSLMMRFSRVLALDKLSMEKTRRRVEIFPKQTKINFKDNAGSFINLPYFNCFDTRQKAILNRDTTLEIKRAIEYIESKRTDYEYALKSISSLPFSDAPPCLQRIYLLDSVNGENSCRNNYLFALGVYFKKKDSNLYEQNITTFNLALSSPLSDEELRRTVFSSLKKKGYQYKCNEEPCINYCEREICKEREYGAGKSDGSFFDISIDAFYKYNSITPYYIMHISKYTVDGDLRNGEIVFDTVSDLRNQDYFHDQVANKLHHWLMPIKNKAWFELVKNCFDMMQIKEVESVDDATRGRRIMYHITEYIASTRRTDDPLKIDAGAVYYHNVKNAFCFNKTRLSEFLDKKLSMKFNIKISEIDEILKTRFDAERVSFTVNKTKFKQTAIKKENIGVVESILLSLQEAEQKEVLEEEGRAIELEEELF